MFERFTEDARQVVKRAQEEARGLRHTHIGTEHLLLGLLRQPESLSAQLLNDHGLDHERALNSITRLLGSPAEDLDADALEMIGIDLSAVREKVEAAFGPGSLDRPPSLNHRGTLRSGRHIPITSRAKKTLELSLREALAMKSKEIRDGHILLGILRDGEGLGVRVMTDAGIDPRSLRTMLRTRLT
ncbi:Clp protease N-terminal domain-containing protein [Sphaerimonospora thailandensis]|uniref:Clp protease n=1 Tax=Sphaerimonospora thailandensis TaxID=795644 RepID=A0A8J3VZ11_9ACTN|nr:Clp protease N-terminal domain-containing protein [Sphaerimonospora thailandensis]GIH69575.1 Clp protease [Sphaerimonospora thailandensis]